MVGNERTLDSHEPQYGNYRKPKLVLPQTAEINFRKYKDEDCALWQILRSENSTFQYSTGMSPDRKYKSIRGL